MSASYMADNFESISTSASLTQVRMAAQRLVGGHEPAQLQSPRVIPYTALLQKSVRISERQVDQTIDPIDVCRSYRYSKTII